MDSQFKELYKTAIITNEDHQEKRRKILLTEQKLQRNQAQDKARGLENFVEIIRKKKSHHGRKTYKQKYDDDHSLQLSEWLKERPTDLERWYLVACPKGQRCLVIASNGITEAYSKTGRRLLAFRSQLPGDKESRHECTILDCIFVEKLSRFFILDALSLSNQNLLHCETEFRFYWIKSRFDENPAYKTNAYNDYSFVPLDYYDFEDDESIQKCLLTYPHWENDWPKLDGYMFYHKEASYTCGVTPLVGWLFAFMVPEVLINFTVHDMYMNEKPENYVNFLNYIITFDENLLKKLNRHRHNKGAEKMLEADDENSIELENVDNDHMEYTNLPGDH